MSLPEVFCNYFAVNSAVHNCGY